MQHTVGILSVLHLYSSMRVCCCTFFASQAAVCSRTLTVSHLNFYSALNVNTVSVNSCYKVNEKQPRSEKEDTGEESVQLSS